MIELVPIRSEEDYALPQAAGTSLLQSWAWGEAKAEAEGWRPRRFRLVRGTETLALVQVLEKSRLWRVNRGPLWARPDLAPADKAGCLGALRAAARWWKGRALLIAPELTEAEGPMLAGLGFRPRTAPHWSSAWVDLQQRDEETLRKALNGKWRNKLGISERAGLAVDIARGTDWLDLLMPRYQAMMREKEFQGIPPATLAALARHGELIAFIARSGGEPVSIVLLARHFLDATYLVGWTSDEGRALKANHLLLWRAMLELKAAGGRSLDLGGIDDIHTPGIATYKRGLSGREYTLAGEFLSL